MFRIYDYCNTGAIFLLVFHILGLNLQWKLDNIHMCIKCNDREAHSTGREGCELQKKICFFNIISLTVKVHVFLSVGILMCYYFYHLYLILLSGACMGRDSSVGIATRYGLNAPGIECRWVRDFPHHSRPVLGPTQPPVQWVPELSWG